MNLKFRKLIKEQFNLADLSLDDDEDSYTNIYDKYITVPEKIYNDILNNNDISEYDIRELDNNEYTSICKVKSRKDLRKIVVWYSKNFPNDSLNWLDVSEITNMSKIFYEINYAGDISKWDVSNVLNMTAMFYRSTFNGDISEWDVSAVTNMNSMFMDSQFNGNISKWDVSNVKKMIRMFSNSPFNHNISQWQISNETNIKYMFDKCPIIDKYKPVF